MGTSPITLGVGNGATLRLLLLLLTTAQGTAPPAQGQPPRARQADFVICDQAIERLINRLKQFRRIATRHEKRGINYLAMLTIGMILLWL
jgi:transposase